MQILKLLLTALLLTAFSVTQAETIAIIGTGNVGGALGPEFAAQGHTVVYGSRNPSRDSVVELVARTGNGASATTQAEAVAGANIVVLAVPGMLVEGITKGLGDLSGKIIIDPTNPMIFEENRVRHAAETSNSEIIQQAAPGASVVKAFNTLNWRFMVEPDESGGPVSIALAGDSAEAKAVVAEIITGMGLEPIDVGALEHARWLEGMAILLINNFRTEPFNFHLRKLEQ